MGFSDEAILLLTKLDQATQEANDSNDGSKAWVKLDTYSKFMRSALVRHGNIEEGSTTNDSIVYRITSKGHDALMKEVTAPAKQKKNGKVSALFENGNGLKPSSSPAAPAPAVTAPINTQNAAPCKTDGCDMQCVYRQAVEILTAKLPGVRELVDALKTIDGKR